MFFLKWIDACKTSKQASRTFGWMDGNVAKNKNQVVVCVSTVHWNWVRGSRPVEVGGADKEITTCSSRE